MISSHSALSQARDTRRALLLSCDPSHFLMLERGDPSTRTDAEAEHPDGGPEVRAPALNALVRAGRLPCPWRHQKPGGGGGVVCGTTAHPAPGTQVDTEAHFSATWHFPQQTLTLLLNGACKAAAVHKVCQMLTWSFMLILDHCQDQPGGCRFQYKRLWHMSVY